MSYTARTAMRRWRFDYNTQCVTSQWAGWRIDKLRERNWERWKIYLSYERNRGGEKEGRSEKDREKDKGRGWERESEYIVKETVVRKQGTCVSFAYTFFHANTYTHSQCSRTRPRPPQSAVLYTHIIYIVLGNFTEGVYPVYDVCNCICACVVSACVYVYCSMARVV